MNDEHRFTFDEWRRITEASFRGGTPAWRAEIEGIIAARVQTAETELNALRAAVKKLADPHGPNYTLDVMRQHLRALTTTADQSDTAAGGGDRG